MGHTIIHVEPVQLQQPDLLCFFDDIYLQKVQERFFLVRQSDNRGRHTCFTMTVYGDLRSSGMLYSVDW
jgi:hypothetical protein